MAKVLLQPHKKNEKKINEQEVYFNWLYIYIEEKEDKRGLGSIEIKGDLRERW